MLLTAAFALAIMGCQKNPNTDPPGPDGSTSVQQISQDDNQLQKIDDDINLDIEIMMTGGGLKSTTWLPCNATIDSTNIVNDTITYYITYHGLNCPGTLFRTGKVEVKKHVGTHWYMPGATVMVQIINMEVTRVATGKTIVINGVKTHKNVTGYLLIQLGFDINTIVHKTHGFMTVNFDDGSNRTWNIARRCLYTGVFNINTGTFDQLVLGVDGFGQVGAYTGLVTWGVARNGDQFYISVPQPVHFDLACNFNPVNGIQVIDIPSADKGATITYGYDSNNDPVIPPACPTKYKVDWYHGQNSGTIFLWL
ncbi:MAG: hypothetical protein D4R67_00580 [Bacteroidetes bacterium]|nr:MAG: hypothetical protein D4R67_00580 [Bacteroidota bacterium]